MLGRSSNGGTTWQQRIGSLQVFGSLLDSVCQDMHYAVRQAGRNRGFVAVVLFTLSLGIGANTAIFGLFDAVVLRRLPVPRPEQLVLAHWSAQRPPRWLTYFSAGPCDEAITNAGPSGCSFSYPVFNEMRQHVLSVSSIAAYGGPIKLPLLLNSGSSPINASVAFVSGDFFATLEIKPAAGRTFLSEDDRIGAERVAVLSYAFWERQFGRDQHIVGKSITLSNAPFTVVGVAKEGFFGLQPINPPEIFVPAHAGAGLPSRGQWATPDGFGPWMFLIARLKPGVQIASANSELTVAFLAAIANDTQNPFSKEAEPRIQLADASRGLGGLRSRFSNPLTILMLIASCVLLIACANLANLLLARASARRGEIEVRMVLGASRRRIFQQLITESLLMALVGAAAGFLFAWWISRALASFVVSGILSGAQVNVNPQLITFVFTTGLAILSVLLFGVVPTFRAIATESSSTIRTGGFVCGVSSSGRAHKILFGRILVAWQVSVALVLLIGAGLFLRTLINLTSMDLGFRPDNVLTIDLSAQAFDYGGSGILQVAYEILRQRLAALPGVISVSWSGSPLLGGSYGSTSVQMEGRPELGGQQVSELSVGPQFFETMQLPVVQGRSIRDDDMANDGVWINRLMADRFYGGEIPIGKRISTWTIIGVVGDAKYESLRGVIQPTIYVPGAGPIVVFEVRTVGDPNAIVAAARQTIHDVAPNLKLAAVKTEKELIDRALFHERLMSHLSVGFGVLALLLTCVGVYGVLAYVIARRTGEIAVRIALGATPSDIRLLVMGEGLQPVFLGVIVGLLGAFALTRLIESSLYGIKALDPTTFVGATAMLFLVSVLACYVPMRRAVRVEPLTALRYE